MDFVDFVAFVFSPQNLTATIKKESPGTYNADNLRPMEALALIFTATSSSCFYSCICLEEVGKIIVCTCNF